MCITGNIRPAPSLDILWKIPRFPRSESGEIIVRGDLDEHVRVIVDSVCVVEAVGFGSLEVCYFASIEMKAVSCCNGSGSYQGVECNCFCLLRFRRVIVELSDDLEETLAMDRGRTLQFHA